MFSFWKFDKFLQQKSTMNCLVCFLMPFYVITFLSITPTEAKCPSRELSWCLQVDGFDSIVLDGSHFRNVSRIFQQIGFLFEDSGEIKELDQVMVINNHALKSLDPNTFCDFRFRRIVIKNCTKLFRVHQDAFNGTNEYVRSLTIDTIAVNATNSEDFFEALNSLVNLEELELRNHRVLKIRPYTFRQPVLTRLHLGGPIETIENNAFYYLDGIRILHLSKSIRYLMQHAFDLRVASNKTLDVYLDVKLGIIDRGVFTYTQRPLTINLYLNKLTNFDVNVFRPVLMSPIRHELIFHGNPKEMRDPCKLVWIFRYKFKGVVTFKDEPLINEAYFDRWRCSEHVLPLDDEVPEIDLINQAGIDASHNGASTWLLEPTGMLPVWFVVLMAGH